MVQTIRQQTLLQAGQEARHRRGDQRWQDGLHWLDRLDGGHVEEDDLALFRLGTSESNGRSYSGQVLVVLEVLSLVVTPVFERL